MLKNPSKKISTAFTLAVLALGLSACGRDNYNGSYTGSQVQTPQAAQNTGGTPQQMPMGGFFGQQMFSPVTAELNHNGDIVTGTYTVNPTAAAQTQTGQLPNMMGVAQTYRFEANANQANRLEAVRLIPMTQNMMGGFNGMGNCILEGTLQAVENGRRLTGTLNPQTVNYNTFQGMGCLPTQITLDRVN